MGRITDYLKRVNARAPKKPYSNVPREPMTEHEFVRKFGTKVKIVHFGGRPDFVGLTLKGERLGFMVVKHGEQRRIRVIMKEGNHWTVTKVYIPLRHDDSASFMWRGLLRYVS